MMKPIDKAIKLRESLKSKNPWRGFQNRMHQPKRILQLVEKHSSESATKLEARRYYIVCLAAAFESYWRDFFRDTIDRSSLTPDSIRHLTKITFTFADVHNIVGRKLTLGELIANAYTFQSASTVNKSFSEVFRFDAFTEFAKAKFELVEVPRKNRNPNKPLAKGTIDGTLALKEIPKIERCFEIRHETVHNTGSRFRISSHQIVEFDHSVWLFNILFSLFIESKVGRL